MPAAQFKQVADDVADAVAEKVEAGHGVQLAWPEPE